MNNRVSAARTAFDKTDTSKMSKEDKERLELARDTEINNAYAQAADEWQAAQSINGMGLFSTFANFELGMMNQVVWSVREGNWLGSGGVVEAIRALFVFAPLWAMRHDPVFLTIFFLYFLCVWSIFGGAIATNHKTTIFGGSTGGATSTHTTTHTTTTPTQTVTVPIPNHLWVIVDQERDVVGLLFVVFV